MGVAEIKRAGALVGAVAIAALGGTAARSAHAQDAPPHVLTLPPVIIPEGVASPASGRVEVDVIVSIDGTAETVDACAPDDAICALVRDAMRAARFEPARRAGQPIAARVRVALRIAESPPPVVDAGSATVSSDVDAGVPPADAGATPNDASAPESTDDEPTFGATARVARPHQAGMRRLELAETRDLPGAFGDPFRAVDALPGVVPILSGLPYFYVRGAPPAGTLYVYDGIPVPTLYHLAVGPAVIHPRMVGPIRLYAGVAPARYGRLVGGVVAGEGPEPPDGRTHAEVELRLLDVSGYIQGRALGGTVTAAVRYGYPALLLSIFSPEVSLAYWDYQLRYATRFSSHDRFELVALGSYDSFGTSTEPDQDVTIQFHRIEPRFVRRVGSTEYGVALLLGWEQSTLGSTFQLHATRVGPRVWLEHRFGAKARLRLSGDLNGVAGAFTSVTPMRPGDTPTDSPGGENLYGDVPARSLWGLQLELGLRPSRAIELQLGGRADAWVQGAAAEAVLDPRVRVILHPTRDLDFHVAVGVVHQPAVFYLPLPGIEDVAVSRGLQSAIQSEAGVGWDAPGELRAELQFFLHHYQNLLFTDVLFIGDSLSTICDTVGCGDVHVPERIDGLSYGAEVFLRRAPEERLSGWISYTLAFSDVDDIVGLPYTPTWDVRHVGNLVLQWNIGGGFSAGLRLHARSGKMRGDYALEVREGAYEIVRYEERLPWFVRLDLQVAYAWRPSWGRMRISLEWFNATLSREPFDVRCAGSPRACEPVYLPAIFFPNLGLRGEL